MPRSTATSTSWPRGERDSPWGTALSKAAVADLGQQIDSSKALFGTEVTGGHIWHLSLTNHASDRAFPTRNGAG